MRYTPPQIAALLKDNIQVPVGRHLYCVLGTYTGLEAFERDILAQFRLLDGRIVRPPLNLNRELLARIGDEDLRALVRIESRRPQAIQDRLNREFDDLLAEHLDEDHFLALKQIELIFAYRLDMQAVRARAANQNHILLLLPGEVRADHTILFAEAGEHFHRELPQQLIADNHLWELENAKPA